MSTANFEALLATHNAEYAQAEAYDNWMPDDGEYVVLIADVETGTFVDEQTGKSNPSWRMTGQLLCESMPDIDRKKFLLGLWRKPTQYGILKTVAKLFATGDAIAGVEASLAQASAIVCNAKGTVVQIRVTTTKDGFHRVNFLRVIDTAGKSAQ